MIKFEEKKTTEIPYSEIKAFTSLAEPAACSRI
jgi:hypothetical protein